MYNVIPNKNLKIKKCKMKCDIKLGDNIPRPLPDESFAMVINGSAGSGKSNLISNLLGSKSMYRKVFHHVIICSPSLNTLQNNIFKDLDETKKHAKFDETFLEYVMDFTDFQSNKDDPETTLVILDDVANQLKGNMDLQRRLGHLVMNRRHRYLSIIITSQQFRLIPLPVRTNITHAILFRPSNRQEQEALMEILPVPKTQVSNMIDFVYDEKYNFLYVDFSLKHSNKYEFYKNFDYIQLI